MVVRSAAYLLSFVHCANLVTLCCLTSLKGFRKGKAPLEMIKKIYGEAIEHDALDEIANTLFSFGTNKKIFNSILLVTRLEKWQQDLRLVIESYARQHNIPVRSLAEARLEE